MRQPLSLAETLKYSTCFRRLPAAVLAQCLKGKSVIYAISR